MSVDEYERLVHLNVAEFQRFSDRVGAKAQEAGMTEDVLRELLTVRTDRKLVIDTNLWISRLLMPGGPAKAVDHGRPGVFPHVGRHADGIGRRARTAQVRPLRFSPTDNNSSACWGIVRVIPINASRRAETPRTTNLDIALNGDARMILTGDNDLLELHPFHGIEILKPADFLNRPAD